MRQDISSFEKDFIASNLRSQLNILQSLLKSMESDCGYERDYAVEALKRIQAAARDLREFLGN